MTAFLIAFLYIVLNYQELVALNSLWLSGFISGRFQRVSVRDHLSSSTSVLNGVIQDSVLGPALYSIYSSSISNLIYHAHYLFYADDLKLIMPLTSVTSHTHLQSDLDRLDKWAIQWDMSSNKDKCHDCTADQAAL